MGDAWNHEGARAAAKLYREHPASALTMQTVQELLDTMSRHGSHISVTYSDDTDGYWECAWIVNGTRAVRYRKDLKEALLAAIEASALTNRVLQEMGQKA